MWVKVLYNGQSNIRGRQLLKILLRLFSNNLSTVWAMTMS